MAGKVGKTMGMILKMHVEAGCLCVAAIGEFSLAEAKRAFLEVLDAVARHKMEKVLLDGRELAGEPATMARFYYGEFAAQAVAMSAKRRASRAPQFAYVLKVPVRDPRRFGETVAVNRSMHVKVFDNLEEAHRWLGLGPANKPDAGDA